MTVRRVAVLLGLVVLAGLLWALTHRPAPPDRGRSGPRTADAGSRSQGRAAAAAVTARVVDDARRVLNLVITDAEGLAVTEGALLVACSVAEDEPGGSGPAAAAERRREMSRPPVKIDGDGRATVQACAGGVTCVRLRHPRLRPSEAWVFEGPGRHDLSVQAASTVAGVVLDADGAPVAGARVSARPGPEQEPSWLPPFFSTYAISDSEGAFAFTRISRDVCDVCAEAAGQCDEESPRAQLPVWAEVQLIVAGGPAGFGSVVVDAEETAPVTVQLSRPEGTVEGTLLDRDGGVFPRARVLVRGEATPDDRRAVMVRDDGSFVLEGLGAGAYILTAVQDGRRLIDREIVTAGDRLDLRVEEDASGRDVRLQILRQGRPAVGVEVFGGPFLGQVTDERGEIDVDGVVPGTYTVRVARGRETLYRGEIALAEDTIDRLSLP